MESTSLSFWERFTLSKGCGFFVGNKQPIRIGDNLLKIKRAAEPNDIIWQNQGIDNFTKLKKRLISFLVVLVVLGFCLMVIYLLNLWQHELAKDNPQSENHSGLLILLVAISLLIIWINGCLIIFIKISTS